MRDYKEYTLLDAKAATGWDKAIDVSDFRHCVLFISGAGTANLTVKFAGSIQEEMPDFDAAQSVTNQFDYVQVKDLEDATGIDGDAGIAFAAANDFRMVEVNVNGLRWLSAVVTTYAAGNVTVKARLFRD